jgi:hypothetical protein
MVRPNGRRYDRDANAARRGPPIHPEGPKAMAIPVPVRRSGGGPVRRTGRRLAFPVVVLVALAFALTAQAAAAGRGWCRTDPVVTIDGTIVDIFAAAPAKALLLVTGPNRFVVTVPVGVETRLIAEDLGFGRGVETTFAESSELRVTEAGIEVRVALYVPATDGTMPVRLEVAPRLLGLLRPASAEGTANAWVSLTTVV